LIRDGEELASHLGNGKAQVVKNLSAIFETGRGITEQEFPRPRDLRIEEIYVLEPLANDTISVSPENGNEE
jgi:hypothetical protein